MLRVAFLLVLVLAPAGCGREAAAPSHGPPSPPSAAAISGLRFVGAPRVALTPGDHPVLTTVFRLNRPLVQDRTGLRARLTVSGAQRADDPAAPSLVPVAGFRRCYSETDAALAPQVGVTVALSVRSSLGERLVARVPVARGRPRVAAIARALRCPRIPRLTRCHGLAPGNGMPIALQAAGGGATCATVRRVMTGVSAWADSGRCFADLCVARHRHTRGFRCTVAQTGEADWRVSCRRGRATVTGTTAD